MRRLLAIFDKQGEPGFMIGELRLDDVRLDDLKAFIDPYQGDDDLVMCYTLDEGQLDRLLALLPSLNRGLIQVNHEIYEYSLEATQS